MNTGDAVSDLQKISKFGSISPAVSDMQPESCPSTSRHLVQSAALCLLAWIGHVIAVSFVKKERTFYDAALGPQPEMSPSISMRSFSCSALWVVQGAGRTRCCQCLQTKRTCDTRREVCSYYQGVTPWNAIARRRVEQCHEQWEDGSLARMETRSKSILDGPASWYEKLAGCMDQPIT